MDIDIGKRLGTLILTYLRANLIRLRLKRPRNRSKLTLTRRRLEYLGSLSYGVTI